MQISRDSVDISETVWTLLHIIRKDLRLGKKISSSVWPEHYGVVTLTVAETETATNDIGFYGIV